MVFAIMVQATAGGQAVAADELCREQQFRSADYVVCEVDPGQYAIRTYWADAQGEAFGSLGALDDVLAAKGETLIVGMNGGMYHPDMRPVGLYVENGTQLSRLSTGCGRQNFSLCPNGVFFVAEGRARVMETKRYRRAREVPDFATQSGPMLVIEGKLHPRFQADSDSRKIRNGVGVRADGRVFLAISSDYVTFYDFALLFRDELETPNALFLDGTISSLHAPSVNRSDGFWPVGPIIAVTRK